MWRGAFPPLFLSAFLCTICLATEGLSFAGAVPYHQAPYYAVHPIRIVQWMVTTPFVVYASWSCSDAHPSKLSFVKTAVVSEVMVVAFSVAAYTSTEVCFIALSIGIVATIVTMWEIDRSLRLLAEISGSSNSAPSRTARIMSFSSWCLFLFVWGIYRIDLVSTSSVAIFLAFADVLQKTLVPFVIQIQFYQVRAPTS
jgi:bacteriorhodopsin